MLRTVIGWPSIAANIVALVLLCVLICSKKVMYQRPTNYILLALFTLTFSYSICWIAVAYTSTSIVFFWATTMMVSFGLGLYAYYTKNDFTGCGSYLFAILLAACVLSLLLGISAMFGQYFPLLHMGLGYLMVVIFSCYIVLDVQLIVGGKHERSLQFGVDDYILAALNLYLDIINLLLYLLQLFGERN